MRNPHTLTVAALSLFALMLTPSAASATTVCDLINTSSCGPINGGLFYTDEVQPAGTGVINSFLRVQFKGTEQGYNTSVRPVQFDEKTDPNFTRDLLLSDVGTKLIGGVVYREFLLDINEEGTLNGDKAFLTLDQLEIFTSTSKITTNNYTSGSVNQGGNNGSLAGATKIYDLDNASGSVNSRDNYVQLDYLKIGKGSGASDLAFYLPDSLFTGATYVYLFSQFGRIDGNTNKYISGAGFEEWFTRKSTPTVNTAVPEPASLLLLGTGLAAAWRRRRRLPVRG